MGFPPPNFHCRNFYCGKLLRGIFFRGKLLRGIFRPRIIIASVGIFLLASLPPVAGSLEARGKFHLGVGLAATSASGDMDGSLSHTLDSGTGPNAYPGELDAGFGLLLNGKYLFNENFGAELLAFISSHDSTHANFGSENIPATLYGFIGAARGILPLSDSLEIFGRAGIGSYTLSYEGNTTVDGNSLSFNSSYSGTGLIVGGGILYIIDPVGFELSYTLHRVSFSEIEGADQVWEIADAGMEFHTLALMVTIGLGNGD